MDIKTRDLENLSVLTFTPKLFCKEVQLTSLRLNYNFLLFKKNHLKINPTTQKQCNALLVKLATMRNTCASEGFLETAVL